MNRGKYAAPRRRRRRSTLKPLLVAMAVVLLIGCVAGGTLAWLTSTTPEVTNTFTTSDINIELKETKTDFKMIPGYTIEKDPKVTVKGGSEACWLFVKIEEGNNLGYYIEYAVDDGWKPLDADDYPGVYYRQVEASADDQTFGVIGYNKTETEFVSDKVLVKGTVTKGDMEKIIKGTDEKPTLTFQAAAVQYNDSNSTHFEAADAYAKIDWNAAATPTPAPTTPDTTA